MARAFAFIHRHPVWGLAVLSAITVFNDDSCGKGHWR